MTRTLCLAIVMLLAGGAHVSALCEAWCGTRAGAAHHEAVGCHAQPAVPSGAAIVEASAACAAAAAVSPFLTEARRSSDAHGMAVALVPAMPPRTRPGMTGAGASGHHPPSLAAVPHHTVLRL